MGTKCVECGRPFKEDENVVITHGDMYDPVHEKCHYSYLLNNRLKDTLSLNEYEKEFNELREYTKRQQENYIKKKGL